MFSPISASENIKEEFVGYITTLFHISDSDYAKQFERKLKEDGSITKGPYLDISDSYKQGVSLRQLIKEGETNTSVISETMESMVFLSSWANVM